MCPDRRPARRLFQATALAALLLAPITPSFAQPISPQDGGALPKFVLDLMRDDPDAFQFRHAWFGHTDRAKQNRQLLDLGLLKGSPEELAKMTAVTGTRNVPIFLAQFSDTGAAPITASDLQKQLFDGPWPTGTMTEYYDEISYGMVQLDGEVFDWVTVANDDNYYAGNVNGLDPANSNVGEFIHEIIDAWDGSVDFGQYDNDGPDGNPNSGDDDGFVDFIGIVHPEIGGECGGPADDIWSHRWRLSGWADGTYTTNDAAAGGGSIRIEDYTIMPALSCSGTLIEIGVFCHEFGHAFGLPDLYDTNPNVAGNSEGIGWWGLMGAGNWNSPTTPAHMSAWSKAELGWINPATVASDLYNWPILSATTSPTAFKLWKNGTPGDEYFLVEYRTDQGFDSEIEAPGLLIWHVDESIANNQDERKKNIDLECQDQTGADHALDADGLDAMTNRGDAGDPFCEGHEFDGSTSPSSVAHNGTATSVMVRNLRGCSSGSQELVADLIVGKPEGGVDLCMRDCGADGCSEPSTCTKFWASPELYIDNNSDGIIDPPAEGIANRLFARVRNIGSDDASNVDVGFYFADPAMGLLFPSTGTLIDTANIPIIASSGAENAMVEWTIPSPPPSINHFCIGVIATNAQDGQLSERAPEDDNVAQINIQELYAKAGSSVPPQPGLDPASDGMVAWNPSATQRSGKADPPFQFEQIVQVCNVQRENSQCELRIVVGSPPEFDDVVVIGNWTWELSFETIQLDYLKCEPLVVKAINHDPVHLDRLELPLTLLCNDEPIGGTVLTFNIDNVPPKPPCSFDLSRLTPPSTDTAPGENQLRVQWRDDFFDQFGFPERVERWRLYVVGSPNEDPASSGELIVETCLDEDTSTTPYDHFADVRPDEASIWYALVAVDQAGNTSEPCFAQVQSIVTDAPQPQRATRLEQNVPNPFNPLTRIAFTLEHAGEVSLRVFDARGRHVRTLVEGAREAGRHVVLWDGSDASGSQVASGQYFYRLSTEHGDEQTLPMSLLK